MKPKPNRVLRTDGRFINVPRHRGQLFVCATGCCCGHVDRGFAPVPTDLYHEEWERRRLRNKIHLTQGGCLGPCPLANVATLFFDGQFTGFQGIDDPKLILALFDHLEALLAAEDPARVPLPALLRERTFDYFTWSALEAHPSEPARALADPAEVENPGILFLTHADTDLLAVEKVRPRLPADFPPVYAHNLGRLGSPAQMEAFLAERLPLARVVVLRSHGGRAGIEHGFDLLVNACRGQGKDLVCVPGTADLDPELTALSNVPLPVIHDTYNYLTLGGLDNTEHWLRYLADNLLVGGFGYDLPVDQPQNGLYVPGAGLLTQAEWLARHHDPARPTAGLLFYRVHWLSGNTGFVDALAAALAGQGFNVLPVFAYSLQDLDENGRPAVFSLFYTPAGARLPDVLVTTTSFALGAPAANGRAVLQELGVPILQAVASGMERDQWDLSPRGLSPLDTAMNVALPELDGRIITVPVSFKTSLPERAGAASVEYVPLPERMERVARQARRLAELQRKPNREKRVAVILTNQAGRASRIGNAVGLDAPASLMNLFAAFQAAGYTLAGLPESGDALIHSLIDRCSYDVEYLTDFQLAQAVGGVPEARYAEWFGAFPERSARPMAARWGEPPGAAYLHDDAIRLAGLELGNVLVALQPPRGYGMDPQAIYHTPDLPPTHHYAAFYRWLSEPPARGGWGADAVLHMGKHGTLEWLPGKGLGLSEACFPDLFLGDLPLVYPFIVNDPGEGMQAKRRAHAVVVDHLTPPMTSAEGYGDLDELRQLVDEYYQLEALDPSKLPLLQSQIWEVLRRAHLDEDLQLLAKQNHGGHTHDWDPTETEDGTPVTLAEMSGKDFAHLMEDLEGYLCELTSAQIRNGLYVLGRPLEGEALTDLLVALTRLPNLEAPSLREAVASALGLDYAALLDRPGARFAAPPALPADRPVHTHADALEVVDRACRDLIAWTQAEGFAAPAPAPPALAPLLTERVRAVLDFVCNSLAPALRLSQQEEVAQSVNGLAGGYVPPGASGAPTRGMTHVLPTGRNFYSVDPRALPSQTAWRVGGALADGLIARYRGETGEYPETVGLVIWGTSAMRTHGDDLAQCFALLGVRPRWQAENRRVIGVEPIPLPELGRPRIDVVMRMSGFFRDAFPHLIDLLDEAVQLVAALDEPPEQNFVRKHVLADLERCGGDAQDARRQATYRLFASRPGGYGAGILPLIEAGNWQSAHDFAEVYVAWGAYAYGRGEHGREMRPVFQRLLARTQVAVKNQDNREHDIFDSDDYMQYHGGMIAAIRALTGRQPRRYFGDSADPARVQVRDLSEEARRVFRTRVVNPKWLESIARHGYKGGLELAATVDYLFGYDATAEVMEDWMYAEVAERYALDEGMQAFLRRSNPWALRDIVNRLQEAVQRGMWRADEEMQQRLRDAYLSVDGDLEDRLDRAWAGRQIPGS